MLKVDQVKSSLDCDVCNKLLVDPVVMPCNNVVCKTYLDKLSAKLSQETKFFYLWNMPREAMYSKEWFRN